MGTTRQLAQFAVQLRYVDLPTEVVEKAKEIALHAWGVQLAGSTLPYPMADIRAVRILAAVAHGSTPTEDVAARREASRQEAVNKSEFINAMIFASAVDTKWGDYDVDSLDPATWAPKK